MNVLAGTPLLPTYARFPVTFVDGEGCWLIADDGERYLDLVAGIAVVGLGHCHPAPLAAAHAQIERLWHVSNLYSTEPMEKLARALSDRFGGAHAFFCNSGAEAVEAALKWARKATGKQEFVALEGSFHGRTMGALSITGPARQAQRVRAAAPGRAVRDARDARTTSSARRRPRSCSSRSWARAACIRSPLETLQEARALADEFGAMLVFDEVQTGMGRTGEFFAWQRFGVRPDARHARQGARERAADRRAARLRRRAHGLRARRPRLDLRRQPGCGCGRAARSSRRSTTTLLAPRARDRRALRSGASDGVRGAGLLLAIELGQPAGPVAHAALEHNLLVSTAGETTLRLTPALTISAQEAELAIELLREVLA